MKSYLFLIMLVLTSLISLPQSKKTIALLKEIEGQWQLDDNKFLSYQTVVDVPGITKDELFLRAENFFISYYNNSYKDAKDVIQTKDKEEGLIIGKAYWPDLYWAISLNDHYYGAYHYLRIDAKEGKARITVTVQEVTDNPVRLSGKYFIPMKDFYPINNNVFSIEKNWQGKAFYQLHSNCKELIAIVTTALNKGLSKSDTKNW